MTEYQTAKTDWSLTAEEGISTADLNRIERNTLSIKEEWFDRRIVFSGNWPSAPFTNALLQLIFINVPAGYKLILDRVNYSSGVGAGDDREFAIGFGMSGEYFRASVDNANLYSGNINLQREIYSNLTAEDSGVYIDVYLLGNANTIVGWSIDFVKLPI